MKDTYDRYATPDFGPKVMSYQLSCKDDDRYGRGVTLLETYYRESADEPFRSQEVALQRQQKQPNGLFVHARDSFPGPLTPLKLRLSHASWTCDTTAFPVFREIAAVDWLRFAGRTEYGLGNGAAHLADPVWTTGRALWRRTFIS